MSGLFGKNVLVVVTGASQGIGQCIVEELAQKVGPLSSFLLLARNGQKLVELVDKISMNRPNAADSCAVLDLSSKEEKFAEKVVESFKDYVETESYDLILIFHNAGTTGDNSKKAEEILDMTQWEDHMHVNLITTISLNNQFLKVLKDTGLNVPTTIVDTTSLLAVRAFPSFSQYSVGKAAREAYFRAIACENDSIKTLSYSPGPVKTDMRIKIANTTFDEDTRVAFTDDEKTSEISRSALTPKQTVTKLLSYLDENTFESGSRVDYFDI
uniref:Sepiapterin reductase n=1 Tax=Rhabditophanes sp. KR3021 TaxID=114890 RepID=A0AC35TT71_9BILA